MKRITVGTTLHNNETAQATCGDSSDNNYYVNYTIYGITDTGVNALFYINGVYIGAENYRNQNGTYTKTLTTASIAPVIMVKCLSVGEPSNYVIYNYVEYNEAITAPSAPTVSASKPANNSDKYITVSFTSPSHPYPIVARELKFYNTGTGLTTIKTASEGSVTYGTWSQYTIYQISGRVKDSNGNWSAWSTAINHTTSSTPETPAITVGTVGATSVELTGSAYALPTPNDSSTHRASMWTIQKAPSWEVIYNSGEDTTNKTSNTVSTLEALTDYRCNLKYQTSNKCWSDLSGYKYFSTATAAGKGSLGGVRLSAAYTKSSNGGVIINTSSTIDQSTGGVIIGASYTSSSLGGTVISANPWTEDLPDPTTTSPWVED